MLPKYAEHQPVICFNINEMIGDAAPAAEQAHTANVLAGLKKLGGVCVAFTQERSLSLNDTLRRAGFDNVQSDLQERSEKVDALVRNKAWGYVSSQPEDMVMAKTAGTRAFGIARETDLAKVLWLNGADKILGSTEELVDIFRFPKTSTDQLLLRSDAAKLLNQPNTHGVRQDRVPSEVDAFGQARVPRDYIQRLLAYTSGRKPHREQINLCNLEWAIRNGSRQEHERAFEMLHDLRNSGNVLGMKAAGELLGYSPATAKRWARRGILPAITVDYKYLGEYLCLRRDAQSLANVMNGLTTYEVAAQLGVSASHVRHLIRTGTLAATETPNGLRVDPGVAERYRNLHNEQREKAALDWPASRVQDELGIAQQTLAGWAGRGLLASYKVGSTRYYNPGDVMAIKRQCEQLNLGFEWIAGEKGDRTLPRKSVARRLEIDAETVGHWTKEGLLPHYQAKPSAIGQPREQYLVAYLDALVTYAGVPVSIHAARRFLRLCSEAGRVVLP